MEIRLNNTMTREKEVFRPLEPGEVKLYTCGLTVYNFAHIGNLRAYVFADTLKRVFLFNGYNVNHVMNITDVGHLTDDEDSGEDKMEEGARREGKTVWEIVDFYTQAFFKDMEKLRILLPTTTCRATRHIDDMIEMIKKIESNGFTYIAGGNVYFDTSKLPDYGKLGRLKLDGEKTRSRVESDPYKRNPFDFVLWFTRYKYENHAMQWDSPWGKGFPGWHIECSAMSSRYLGERFDIHTGGIDHIPVHHTNEIAQSEAAFGHEWVNYWLHSEFLVIGEGEKMSKSLGNFITLQTLADSGYDPLDYRYYLLGAHYRKQLAFSLEALDGARNAMRKLRSRISQFAEDSEGSAEINRELLEEFHEAINDDLNTPRALAVLWKVVDSDKLTSMEKLSLINEFDRVFALGLSEIERESVPEDIQELARDRSKARENRQWDRADELRKAISEKGYEILDERDGYSIRKK